MTTVCEQNVTIRTEGRKLLIEVDLDTDFGRSNSGKSIIVASTGGFVKHGGVSVGLNVVKALPKGGGA